MSRDQMYFYQNLPPFSDFNNVLMDRHYQPVPENWLVAVADIAGSTQAVEEGRYKDINVIGASAIIAVLNACGTENIAFIFGGDGASFIFSPEVQGKIADALLQTQIMAKQNFGFHLRVGIVPVSEIYKAGHALKIAKYKIASQTYIAMARGGGMSFADTYIKEKEKTQIQMQEDQAYHADFTGLECRWNPMPSQRGEVLTLMVQTRKDASIYQDVLSEIARIYKHLKDETPISQKAMSLSLSWSKLKQEYRVRTDGKAALHKYLYGASMIGQICLGKLIFAFDWHVFGIPGRQHMNDIIEHTDYQKFDDMLRMIIDGTPEEHREFERYLEQEYQVGNLFYGMERADSALMTCLIFDRSEHHIHFVDGSGGGYTFAARQMKQQMEDVALNKVKKAI